MQYVFKFTSTSDDLLDAYDAERTASTGLRSWVRWVVGVFGFLWLVATAFALTAPGLQRRWLAGFFWTLVGGTMTWHFLVKPALKIRRIRASRPETESLALSFDREGISVETDNGRQHQRSWDELVQVLPSSKGVVMIFTDRMAHWLPNRVFSDESQRLSFVEAATSRIVDLDDEAV